MTDKISLSSLSINDKEEIECKDDDVEIYIDGEPKSKSQLTTLVAPDPPKTQPLVAPDSTKPLSIEEIYGKLLTYQIPHTKTLVTALESFGRALDCSSTGCGKTHCAVAIAALLKLKLFVVCPKSVIYPWRKVGKIYNIEFYGISNYESLKGGKHYDQNGIKCKCPYVEYIDNDYKWNLPTDTLLVFDEVHKCKNIATQNSKLLTASKTQKCKIMMLSATVADKPEFFANCAYMLGLCPNVKLFNIYTKSILHKNPSQPLMLSLHKKIFPKFGSRLKISDLGDAFPSNQVIAEAYSMDVDVEKQIQEQYELLSVAYQHRKKQEAEAYCILEKILRARQKIEALKVQTFLSLAEDYLEGGFSVVIFVNFKDTMNLLASKLNTSCLIHGSQTLAERNNCIDRFQDNKEQLIICQIQSGGTGVSLHDLNGNHPRVSLISPSFSSSDLVQALGRIHRANGRSKCLQRIIFCANTIEEKISENLQQKINNYSQINDGLSESTLKLTQETGS